MSPEEQIKFVNALGARVIAQVVDTIEAGKVPAEWDGIELRQYLADKFADCIFKGTMTPKRKRAYNNTVLVNNL